MTFSFTYSSPAIGALPAAPLLLPVAAALLVLGVVEARSAFLMVFDAGDLDDFLLAPRLDLEACRSDAC